MGVNCIVNLIDADPTEEQVALFGVMIRAMLDVSAEFIVFEFQNSNNKAGGQQGLVFYQVCRDGKMIHAEVRIDGPEGRKLYSVMLSDDDATALLRQLIETRTAPDLTGWKDITDDIFQDDSEFE